MQVWPGENPRSSEKQSRGRIALYAFLCFSLAGLIAGFAFGGFVGHASGNPTGKADATATGTRSAEHSPTPSTPQTVEDVALGLPIVGAGDYSSPEKADGATGYTFSAQIVNKADNTPITATDVTCRLWLTDDANATSAALSANNYALPRTISAFARPFPHEIANALNFTSSSQQTQPCASNGKTRWTYTLAAAVHHGAYFLAVLADWKGVHYNWYLVRINVANGAH